MTAGSSSQFPEGEPDFPDCFLPESSAEDCSSFQKEDLVMDYLPDEGKLPKVLAFREEPLPQWTEAATVGNDEAAGEGEVMLTPDFAEDYAIAHADAKSRLNALISGFESEKQQAFRRQEQLEQASETLRFHQGRMGEVQTGGFSRPRLIRELERGLVALDAAERDLDHELSRAGLRKGHSTKVRKKAILQEWLLNGKKFTLVQILAFLLPLLVFGIVALILIGTALRWF